MKTHKSKKPKVRKVYGETQYVNRTNRAPLGRPPTDSQAKKKYKTAKKQKTKFYKPKRK